jgi:hypothetical protein
MPVNDQFKVLDSIRFRTSTLKRLKMGNIAESRNGLTIGEGRVKNPFKIRTPLFLPPHLTRKLDHETYLGVSLGSSLAGANMNLHGPLSSDAKELARINSSPLVLDLSGSRIAISNEMLRDCSMVWIEIGGNEFPLRIDSSSEETRIPPEIDEPKDLIHLVSLFREMLEAPVVLSVRGLDIDSDMDNILVTSADAVHISCGFDVDGSTGPASRGLTSEPVTSAVEALKHMEVFRSGEKGVKILLSGPFRDSTDIIKLRAMGIDGFGLDMSIENMIRNELGSENDEPDWALIGEKVEESFRSIIQGIGRDLDILGLGSLEEVNRDMLVVDNYHAAALTGLPLSGYGMEIPFWRH